MARIAPAETQQLDKLTADTLNAVRKKIGKVPNLFTTLALAPAALNSYLAFNDAVAGGELSVKQRETIALAVAQFNQCQYCLSAHSAIGKGAGLSNADIERARSASGEESVDDSMAAFAREVTEARGTLTDDRFNHYQEQGLSPALMIEIVANVALNLFTNYINHLADTDVDFPVVDLQK